MTKFYNSLNQKCSLKITLEGITIRQEAPPSLVFNWMAILVHNDLLTLSTPFATTTWEGTANIHTKSVAVLTANKKIEIVCTIV